MKKYVVPMLMLYIFLVTIFTPFALATSTLPEQQGLLTDPVGLFSESEAESIKGQAAEKTFEVVVLTAEGLSEQEGERLAQQAYDTWGLNRNQLMLVITVDPNYVHLVFDHLDLTKTVAQSELRNAQGIIEASFVPLAQQGKLAEGVLAVSELVNSLELQPASSEAPTVPVDSGKASSSSQGQSGAEKQTNVGVLLLCLIFVSVFIFLFNFLSRRLRKVKQLRERLSEITEIVEQALASLNKMMASELLREWEQGFLQGETATVLSQMEQTMLPLHQQSSELKQRLGQQQIAYLSSFPKLEEELTQLGTSGQQLQEQIGMVHEQWLQVEKAAKEVAALVETVKQKAVAAIETLEKLTVETSYPLGEIKQELKEALTLLEQADQIDEFDVLGGQKLALEAEQQIDLIQENMQELQKQLRLFSELPLRIQQQEEHLREWVAREQLLLIDADPFSILIQTEPLLKKVEQLLQTGDVEAAADSLQQLEAIINKAQDTVRDMISKRNEALETVKSAEALLAELESFDQAFEQEMEKLQREFVEECYQEQYVRYAQIKQDQETLKNSLPTIKALADVRVQKYQEAFQNAQQVNTLIKRLGAARDQSISLYQHLTQELIQIGQQFSTLKGEFYQALALYEQSGLEIASFNDEIRQAEKGIEDFQELSNVRPVAVSILDSQRVQLQTVIDAFLQKVVQLVKAKKEAEERYHVLNNEFEQSLRRYGSKIRVKKYVAAYQKLQRELEQLLRAGRFSEINNSIIQGESIIQQMEQEYRKRLRNERRGGGSGPFIGGGGGGRSSGGSSWGSGRSSGSSSWGGSRSSGSSGWGGGGGRSSGSSGWGGGRSSGSSKW